MADIGASTTIVPTEALIALPSASLLASSDNSQRNFFIFEFFMAVLFVASGIALRARRNALMAQQQLRYQRLAQQAGVGSDGAPAAQQQ